MTRLFTYVIPIDDGAAPNPFWGVCTLAICKPRIRAVAEIGDWVAGVGSKNSPQGDLSGKLVYAMRVTDKLSMQEYDAHCRTRLVEKIPSWGDADWRRRLGDSVYDFSSSPPRIRESVHGEQDRERDLGGGFVLLSSDFRYLGDRPIDLPESLRPVSELTQGHRSNANETFVQPFLEWLAGLDLERNCVAGTPQVRLFDDMDHRPRVGKSCSPVDVPVIEPRSRRAC